MPCLFRCRLTKYAVSPPGSGVPHARAMSPAPLGSSLITRAPKSASMVEQKGPARAWLRSSTVTSSSGRRMRIVSSGAWPGAWTVAYNSAAVRTGDRPASRSTPPRTRGSQMASEELSELRMDPAALYREDVYTDRRMGTIRVMTPVTADGSTDLGRPLLYVGETQILTSVGALPVVFEIEAKTSRRGRGAVRGRRQGGRGADHAPAAGDAARGCLVDRGAGSDAAGARRAGRPRGATRRRQDPAALKRQGASELPLYAEHRVS